MVIRWRAGLRRGRVLRWAAAQCKALERTATSGEPSELRDGAAAVRAYLDVVKVRVRVRAGEAK